jgi:hypothetical protein
MLDGEQLIAEKTVPLRDQQVLHVQISQHETEDFWRVAFSNSHTARQSADITVAGGESFVMSLIEEAIGGQESAWDHLAQWGHSTLLRPVTVFGTAAL